MKEYNEKNIYLMENDWLYEFQTYIKRLGLILIVILITILILVVLY